jgi:hypothetical protein
VIWFFERAADVLRIETTHDQPAGQYLLTVYRPDGAEQIERFTTEAACQQRLEALEQQLRADRWRLRLVHPKRPE